MTTTWTELASEIVTDALQHLSAIGEGETPTAEEQQIGLRGLDQVLKGLPLYGYSWPKLSTETALTWVSGQTIALPADYYGYPVVWRTVGTAKTPLEQIPHGNWVNMSDRNGTGVPTHFYVSPANLIYFWPAPTVDPVATIQYQKLLDDSVLATTPNLPSYWMGPLGFGVADAISLKFPATPPDKRAEIRQRWIEGRKMALASAVPNDVLTIEVDG